MSSPDLMNQTAWMLLVLFVAAFIVGPLVVFLFDR
jgi:hypothetical protein